MKKVVFTNKPTSNKFGIYNFDDTNETLYFNESNSLPPRYDKFESKALYTNSIDNLVNFNILEGGLQFSNTSYINIQSLNIANAGVRADIKRINTYVFLCDSFHPVFTDKQPIEMSGQELYDACFSIPDRLLDNSMIYNINGQFRGSGQSVGNIIQNQNILEDLYEVNDDGKPSANFVGLYAGAVQPETFKTDIAFRSNYNEGSGNLDGIFDYDGNQKIYIIVYTSGDMSRKSQNGGDRNRKNRTHIFEIDVEELYGTVGSNDTLTTEPLQLEFDYSNSNPKISGRGKNPAFIVDELKLSIVNVRDTSFDNYNPDEEKYGEFFEEIRPPKKIRIGENFNFDFLESTPRRQILATNKYNYTPISNVSLQNIDLDIQTYYDDFESKLLTSSPNNCELKFNITTQFLSDNLELEVADSELNHMFFVISWNDVDDKFNDWNDVFNEYPESLIELSDKQDEDLYIFAKMNEDDEVTSTDGVNDLNTSLYHLYKTPGIKNIKTVMFSYNYDDSDNTIEPIRWKLITTRIFINQPLSQISDFSEVGGNDFTTLPWPFTTPIIGGVDVNSKYYKSLVKTLSGGGIGNADVIDEIKLSDAIDNDEIGQTIKVFDLEQVRYFNKSYDMYELLGINPIVNNQLIPFNNANYDGETNKYSEETSVGQIFISDNQDIDLKQSCKLELNTGELTGKSIYDSSGNSNKGILIGDYKVKKVRKGEPMRRDTFIKLPKKTGNRNGAL